MKRAPTNQASFFVEPAAPIAPKDPPPALPPIAPPPLVRGSRRGKAPKDERIPRKLGDVFVCWVCGKEKAAEKGTRAWWVQYGHHKTSGHLRLIACSTKCDRKRPWCCNCGAEGHDKSDGPEVCARYHKGPRNRALPLYRCYAHRIVDRHLTDKAQGWTPGGPPDTLAKLLIEHGGDFSRIREVISTAYCHPHPAYTDEFGNRLIVLFEQAVRDDPDYGVEYPRDTPEQIVERAKLSVARHRNRLSRPGRSLDGHMSEADALAVIADKTAKTGAIQRAIDAYGTRASTPDAERVLVPLLSREDSPIRASAAWALFTHRTESVRAAMLARADVEDVPLLKAYLEQLGEAVSTTNEAGWFIVDRRDKTAQRVTESATVPADEAHRFAHLWADSAKDAIVKAGPYVVPASLLRASVRFTTKRNEHGAWLIFYSAVTITVCVSRKSARAAVDKLNARGDLIDMAAEIAVNVEPGTVLSRGAATAIVAGKSGPVPPLAEMALKLWDEAKKIVESCETEEP